MNSEEEGSGRKAILVLGMHRSGTSALAGVLGLAGADMPSHLMPADEFNEAGYWESQRIEQINEELLSAFDKRWYDLSGFSRPLPTMSEARAWADRILEVLRDDFHASTIFVVKDPRLCIMLPLWREVVTEFGAALGLVLVIRNPLDVCASLERVHSIQLPTAQFLWLRYVLESERASRGLPRSFVAYERLLSDGPGVVRRLGEELNLEWPQDVSGEKILRFLSPDLQHYGSNLEDVLASESLAPWVKSGYELLLRVVEGRESREVEDALDRIREELEWLDRAADRDWTDSRNRLEAAAVDLAEANGALTALRQEVLALEESVRAAKGELKEALDTAATQRVALGEAQRKLDDVMEAADSDRQALAAARDAAEALRARVDEAEARSARARAQLQAVISSKSWAVTAPLRRLASILRREA